MLYSALVCSQHPENTLVKAIVILQTQMVLLDTNVCLGHYTQSSVLGMELENAPSAVLVQLLETALAPLGFAPLSFFFLILCSEAASRPEVND